MKFLKMFKYPFLSGIFLPFKIWQPTYITIKKGVNLKLTSRVTFGNNRKNSAIVSQFPINLFIGDNANINIGHSVFIGGGVNIIVKQKAHFSIGSNTYFTSDSHIEVVNSIIIGDNCAVSWGVTIIDDDHHQIIYEAPPQKIAIPSVEIGNKVWIGCNVTILKNTIIGNNSVVAAGSVVKGVFPDNSLIAGNPAKLVKQNIYWK